jgi:hypothetical protein
MADEAINYMNNLNAVALDKPFFVYYVPGGSHSPHQPTKEWIAVRLKPRASRGTRIMSRLVLQSRTGVGTNCKSAFPGARTQGGIRATDLSRLSFNILSFSPKKRRHGAGLEPLFWSTWLNQRHQRRARKRRGPHAGDDSTSHHAGRGLPGTVARPSFDCGNVLFC